ncbi:hypothetical protein [Mucisphaera sp.]|uniref:hypothetical protein n=1 Tax=Mucisphaera sp. TaxID=2913024 RepID=UPI003D15211D
MRGPQTSKLALCGLMMLFLATLTGCQAQQPTARDRVIPSDEEIARQNEALQMIQRQQASLQQPAEPDWSPPPPAVRWIDHKALGGSAPEQAADQTQTSSRPPVLAPAERPLADSRIQPAESASTLRTQRPIPNVMLDAVRDSGWLLTDPTVDPELSMSLLSRQQREQISRLRRLLLAAERQAAEEHMLDLNQLAYDLRGIDEGPVSIQKIELCTSVSGYGVYDTLDSRRLLAGREHPMIVYLELEGFQTEISDGWHHTRITQEVRLYERRDGLMVWRQEPVEVVDRSKNRRRDFFMVQLIRLPSNLGVGEYRLKARVKDNIGQTISEDMIDLTVVADRSLVDGEERSTERSTSSRTSLAR